MALPEQRPVNVKYYTATITSQALTASGFASVVGRGQLIGARVSQGGATTVDGTLSALVNGVTVTGSTMTQTATGSVTGQVTTMTFSPIAVQDGDWIELRRGAGPGTATGTCGVTFIVRETTV